MFANRKIALVGVGLVIGTASTSSISIAQAATLTYTGTTAVAPTWNRPTEDTLPSLSTTGTEVRYSVRGFSVSASGSYTIQSQATTPTNWDNFTVLYRTAFNPNTPLVNFITDNDDLNGIIGSSGFTVTLSPNINYFLVTTGASNTERGSFTNSISGGGEIGGTLATAVPEPATILGNLAALGLGIYTKRKLRGKKVQSIDKETR